MLFRSQATWSLARATARSGSDAPPTRRLGADRAPVGCRSAVAMSSFRRHKPASAALSVTKHWAAQTFATRWYRASCAAPASDFGRAGRELCNSFRLVRAKSGPHVRATVLCNCGAHLKLDCQRALQSSPESFSAAVGLYFLAIAGPKLRTAEGSGDLTGPVV